MNIARNSDDFLLDSERAGLYYLPTERWENLGQQARRHGFHFLTADLSACRTTAEALSELGRAFAFPAWYGANFDALLDCLADPDWLMAPGQILLISGFASLRRSIGEDLSTLQEVLAAAAEERKTSAKPLWIVIDAPARGITPCPGA
ncbi:MAG: hypothetical protein CVU34_15895 [Betaproteobacteria bacterium HGW-Betaproteobacteria-7]|jgi:RNAse (barnase) inhibitor barstar|nr:MAG: hypothetical protein CVU34_15895 [Betaproteobacteria bacterium HGW-Betaproteobacteria-7]